jgi:predicted RND superfamily exporter protein
MEIDPTIYLGFGSVPVITALVEFLKRSIPEMPDRFWPLAALVCGVAWNVGLAHYVGGDLAAGFVFGILAGLASSGLYSQVKTTAGA